ncbi:MAG TPA: hypothetical protein VN519_06375 [Bryobacteraceae bacterium]|nr:hypothetical protein [Bryobacteraceae bacterium]
MAKAVQIGHIPSELKESILALVSIVQESEGCSYNHACQVLAEALGRTVVVNEVADMARYIESGE